MHVYILSCGFMGICTGLAFSLAVHAGVEKTKGLFVRTLAWFSGFHRTSNY